MGQYAEITKEAFQAIAGKEDETYYKVENLEIANKYYYSRYGVFLMKIENLVPCVTQYYVQDINW